MVFANGRLRFDRERHDDLAVKALPDVRHEAAAVAVKPALRQLFGECGQIFAGRFVDLEVHQLSGLGNQLGLGGRKSRRPRFVVLIVASTMSGADSVVVALGLAVGRIGQDHSYVSWKQQRRAPVVAPLRRDRQSERSA